MTWCSNRVQVNLDCSVCYRAANVTASVFVVFNCRNEHYTRPLGVSKIGRTSTCLWTTSGDWFTASSSLEESRKRWVSVWRALRTSPYREGKCIHRMWSQNTADTPADASAGAPITAGEFNYSSVIDRLFTTSQRAKKSHYEWGLLVVH